MSNVDPEENALYSSSEQLHPLVWQGLGERTAAEVAAAAGARWTGEAFLLSLLGQELMVCPGARRVARSGEPERPVGYQRGLVAVTYLTHALAVDPRGDWVTPRELPGGDAFFRGPHSLNTPALERAFGERPQALLDAGQGLGAAPCDGADVALQVAALPRIPVRVLLWGATEEFSPAANLLLDPRAHLHLPLDALWALTNLLISDLTKGVA